MLLATMAITACKKNPNFIADNAIPTGVGSYPISANTLIDIGILPSAVLPTASSTNVAFSIGRTLKYELQYFSQSPIKEINIYETIGTGTRNKIKTYPYAAAYSLAKATDTLIINYTVPTAIVGTTVKVETEVLNQNSLNVLRPFYYKTKL